ncbi:phosphoribosylaminoimidazolesuccinocarboxamide synthase [Microlunatus sp. GCM10028923]|uniref:phosphoribosylaminoimidazolesuccinocarboxamide synthase n=1 Tax=Microlunatus sp. GCM10028923 TaxID=3273400 RepID=UPI00361DD723
MTELTLLHQGKVRDIYTDRPGEILLVASDRVSTFDVVHPTPVPDKGKVLTALSLWWFEQFADVPNHVLSVTDVPEQFAGRAMRCRQVEIVPVECIARGYLSGTGLNAYRQSGEISGVRLPEGLVEASQLPEPVFTPSTKAPVGQGHDELITFEQVVGLVGAETAAKLRDLTLDLYTRAAKLAESRGVIIGDTKFEFGRTPDGEIILADEIFTPDSSRFWAVDEWEPGRPQNYLDKQYLRNWVETTGWDKTPPAPELPAEVVAETRRRYIDMYERFTGTTWSS